MQQTLKLYPGRLVLISIISLIVLGTLLLSLPIARTRPIPLIDIMFTAASATSITGILTVPMDSFSLLGHIIILVLMQIGGLGLVTLTIFSISFFVELGLGAQLMIGEILEMDSWHKTRKRLMFIISLTLITELIGASFFYPVFAQQFPPLQAGIVAFFHAVSSFCNVGLTLFGENNMIPYRNNAYMVILTGLLVFIGGFGFLTWHEVFAMLRAKLKKKRYHLSLNTRITLWTNFLLLAISSFLLFFIESGREFSDLPLPSILLNVLFNALSYRSTGFTTLAIPEIHYATLFIILVFAFIGSSSGSTGSGVKQTTFAIFFATMVNTIRARTTVHLFGRRIALDQILKATAIISLGLGWITLATFLLLLIEPTYEFIDILFEVVSSFTNLGLSTGITRHLSPLSKLLIIMSMIVGRIGSLTLILAFIRKRKKREFEYPEERVVLS